MQKWDYSIVYCWFDEKCKLCLDEHKKPKAHWILDIYDNKHHYLKDGLQAMGSEGWELVSIQPVAQRHGGAPIFCEFYPPHWYIFKKPIDN